MRFTLLCVVNHAREQSVDGQYQETQRHEYRGWIHTGSRFKRYLVSIIFSGGMVEVWPANS